MKKTLLLLLFTIASYGQAVFDEGIQIKNNTADNSATKVNVQSTDGTINTISKADLVNVAEVNDVPSLPLIGEVGKIYVVKNLNKIYRWNGTFYQELAGSNLNYQSIIDALTFTPENVANKATDFTTVNNTLYPSVQAVKNEIINSKNYVSVKDFGATGNGVTDDTPAINSALTYCETINGTLFFPSGNYLTTGNFIINSKISIKGEGETLNIITDPLPTQLNAGSSNVISSSTTNNLFVVNVDGVSFENITLSCSVGSTTGAGVLFNKGNVMRMNNVGVRSFNINVDVVNGASWNISNCDFYNPITNNISINHLLLTDGGDQSIFSCNFFTGARTAITHLLYRGGGGLKITNSKINQGGGTAALAKECIKLTNDVGNTVDFLVSNSSFENYTDRAINISPVFQFENIIINGNQFSASATTSIDVILIGTSLAHNVVIANNIIDSAVNGVNYALGTKISVDNNLFGATITNRYVYPSPFNPKLIPSKVSIGNLDPQYNFNVYSDNDKTVNAYNVVSSVLSKDPSSQQGLFFTLKGGLSTSDRYAAISSYENGFGGLPLVFQNLGGKVFINKTTDDGTGAELQINGTISASPATTANQVPTWGQVQAAARPYKVYTALLTQTGINAPVATVLENTLGGTIVWSYVSIGQYRGTLTGAFLANKTVVFLTNVYGKYFLTGGRENDNSVMIGTQAPNGGSTNGDLSNSSIEIRVYN